MAIGIFTQPYAVSLVGPILGFLLFMVVVFYVYLGMHNLLMVSVDLNYKKSNLEGVAKKVLGNKGRYFILVLLVLAQMSVFIGANLFIGRGYVGVNFKPNF